MNQYAVKENKALEEIGFIKTIDITIQTSDWTSTTLNEIPVYISTKDCPGASELYSAPIINLKITNLQLYNEQVKEYNNIFKAICLDNKIQFYSAMKLENNITVTVRGY